jgi:hypothetical protein
MSGLCDVPLRLILYRFAFLLRNVGATVIHVQDVKQTLRGLTASSDVEHGRNRHFDDHLRSRLQRTDDLDGDGSRKVGVLVIQPPEAADSARRFY